MLSVAILLNLSLNLFVMQDKYDDFKKKKNALKFSTFQTERKVDDFRESLKDQKLRPKDINEIIFLLSPFS